MCCYCTKNLARRTGYIFTGDQEKYDLEGEIKIDKEDSILVNFEWNDEYRSLPDYSIRMALSGRIMINYCPWCGRKMEGSK